MKKNYFLPLLFTLFTPALINAQSGPGGIGNSSTMEVWLDASQLNLNNNDPVSSFTDFSGNNNHAEQASSTFRPIYKTNQINGRPAIEFDGSNDRMDFLSNITNFETTTYLIFNSGKFGFHQLLTTQNHLLSLQNKNARLSYNNFNQNESTIFSNDQNSFVWYKSGSGSTNISTTIFTKSSAKVFNRQASINRPSSQLGAYFTNGNFYLHFFFGQIAEVIVFNKDHNLVQQRIVRAYLSAKYDLNQLPNLYHFASTHPNEVFGIGQESSGGNYTAKGSGIVEISNATSLDNGDYLLIGHDGGSLTTTTSVGKAYASNRFNRIWRASLTNIPGNIDIKFYLDGNNFATDPSIDYRLLIDNNSGLFDNAGINQSISGGVYNAIDQTITFSNISLNEGDYFTLADRSDQITAVNDGLWSETLTWDCGCIPTDIDNITIPSPISVEIDGATATANSITIDAGGLLKFSSNDSLKLYGDLLNNGSIDATTGTLAFLGSVSQELWNNSATPISLFNVFSSNPVDLSIRSGAWELKAYIKIQNGQFINNGGSFTFISDATANAQIEQSSSNAFVGRFIMQRYFSTRPANYADLTTPVQSTTFGDWDQELFMSGVGGNDGDARDGADGPIFYSVTTYDNTAKSYVYITDTATALTAGLGVELFLGDNLTTFSAQTIDHKGTPFTGTKSFTLQPGMNFIGNPHYSFINYNSVSKPAGVTNQFYIYEQSSGSYRLFNGGFIPHSQGFWVNNASGTAQTLNIGENNKFSLASSLIYRHRDEKQFKLIVNSLGNGFNHEISLTPSYTSKYGTNLDDAPYLESPTKTAPAIILKKENLNMVHSIVNSMDNSHHLPITFKAGENGSYAIEAKDVSELLAIYGCVLLEDKVEGKVIDLNSTSTYTFASTVGEYNRFNLHLFKSAEDCQELLNKASQSSQLTNGISIVKRGQIVELNYAVEEAQQAQVDIYNLNGQKVAATQYIGIDGNGSKELDFTTELNGIHLIVVRTNNEVITEKFNF